MYQPDSPKPDSPPVPAEAPAQERAVPSLSYAYARRHQVLLEGVEGGQVRVVLGPDAGVLALAELRRWLGRPLRLRQVDAETFEALLQQSYEQGANEAMQMAGELHEELDLSSVAQELGEPEDLLETEDDAPIIRLINALLTEAIKADASDIHIEPFENRLVVRMRVDGVLREVLEQKRAIAPLIVSRIKVMAKLDIAEKRLPQDGRISLKVAGRAVDVRVSTMPSGHGERVVLRLLDKRAGRLDLEQLGMSERDLMVVNRMIHKPHGIILVTGPTGSGKTTTLYAALTRLNERSRNIMTVEDPIEYYLDGINQTQVNTKVDMTFARGLRAILRQDPDVVMVGEIRDLETAEIAVQASLTGHLVLSTLLGVIAQRLVRLLCPHCKKAQRATPADCELLGVDPATPPVIYHPQGCPECNHSGYRGRTGIYEVVEVDDELRTMIHDGSSEQAMEAHARRFGPSIRQDGVRRVLAGDTSLEEVLRVTRED